MILFIWGVYIALMIMSIAIWLTMLLRYDTTNSDSRILMMKDCVNTTLRIYTVSILGTAFYGGREIFQDVSMNIDINWKQALVAFLSVLVLRLIIWIGNKLFGKGVINL